MTRAAQELYIAQPSFSQTIGRLEEELGVPLFDRQGRQIRINQFGKAFLEHVEHIFAELEDGQRKVRDMAGLDQGQVSLMVTALRLMPDILNKFLALHPAVSFHLSHGSMLQMQHQLEHGNIDLCISALPIVTAGIYWQPLLTEEIFLVVPPGHRLAGRGIVFLLDVAEEVFVSVPVGDGLRDLMDSLCRQAGFTPRVLYEGNEPAAIYDLVEAGLGLAFAPTIAWTQAGESGETWLHITNPCCHRTLGLAWHEERYLSKAARSFRQFIIAYFEQKVAGAG
ncbi:LysR family transcriptional regulator [Dictyobacter alpinus]|uniref:LysR family transcriptional regulator n=1 Tax=Dictyobacter alpinus TaxID=2014873 RepID=A0A402BEF5_9CHLR|nr:LysR substrate-binding domain-containing protein [Dictyobacter alpinus]GCE29764.1 LysR family transcriptional regulator [Dictyobacter alpinus]